MKVAKPRASRRPAPQWRRRRRSTPGMRTSDELSLQNRQHSNIQTFQSISSVKNYRALTRRQWFADTANAMHHMMLYDIHTQPLMALCPGLPRWAATKKLKPIWILLKQETVSGSGISWAICKSALRSRQITTPAPHHSAQCRLAYGPANATATHCLLLQ